MVFAMKTANLECVPVYDRPTDLADGDEICHACGQVYEPTEFDHNFCLWCAPAPDQEPASDGPLTWTDEDVQSTLAIVFDNEALAILRMAQA